VAAGTGPAEQRHWEKRESEGTTPRKGWEAARWDPQLSTQKYCPEATPIFLLKTKKKKKKQGGYLLRGSGSPRGKLGPRKAGRIRKLRVPADCGGGGWDSEGGGERPA